MSSPQIMRTFGFFVCASAGPVSPMANRLRYATVTEHSKVWLDFIGSSHQISLIHYQTIRLHGCGWSFDTALLSFSPIRALLSSIGKSNNAAPLGMCAGARQASQLRACCAAYRRFSADAHAQHPGARAA